MLIVERIHRIGRSRDGFTLVEMLVGLLTGMVVTFALLAMLQVTTNQTRLVTDRVQADRLGRQSMTHIVDELHSACVAREAVPVYASSTPSKLVFFNAYTEGAEVKTPSEAKTKAEGVYVHEIVYEPGVNDTGKLVEKVYPTTTVALPSEVTYSSAKPERTILIAEHITQMKTKLGATLPVFEYQKYRKEATNEANAAITSLETIKLGETESLETYEKTKAPDAASVSGVQINFEQTPVTKEKLHEEEAEHLPLTAQVTLSLGSPAAETPIVDAPCD